MRFNPCQILSFTCLSSFKSHKPRRQYNHSPILQMTISRLRGNGQMLGNGLVCAVLCLVTQSCPARCDPMDCTPPGSSGHWQMCSHGFPLPPLCPSLFLSLSLPTLDSCLVKSQTFPRGHPASPPRLRVLNSGGCQPLSPPQFLFLGSAFLSEVLGGFSK